VVRVVLREVRVMRRNISTVLSQHGVGVGLGRCRVTLREFQNLLDADGEVDFRKMVSAEF
jgi:hypothetical protein